MEGRFFAPGSITQVPSWGPVDDAGRVATVTVPGAPGSLHDPPLEPRDEAVFLLTAAAEIEHALMVQYLYAAYSVRVADPNRDELAAVQDLLTQIAREEMGHLATVQNLLHLIGGPLNLNRDHSPYSSAIYPFRFTLAHASTGRISHPRARAWAHLFNLRYRLLLGQFSHFLRLDHDLYTDAPGPQLGDRTDRGLLLIGTFDEMRHLKKIAGKLVQLPKDDPPGPVHAGPPFELPYTLNLPDSEPQRWRMHLDASRAAVRLVHEQLQPDDAAADADGFLTDLVSRDAHAQIVMQSLAEGSGVPPESLPTGFGKAVTILEEAVRGFTIGQHGNLWAERTRDQFLDVRFFGQPPVGQNPDGTVDRDPDTAPLVQRLEGPAFRMPLFRPPVPGARIGFIRQWIAEGCPDNTPPGQIGVEHERDPQPEP